MLKDATTGKIRLKRVIALIVFIALTGGFCYGHYLGKADWIWFLAFPVGVIIGYFPQMAENILRIWKTTYSETSYNADKT